MNWITIGILAIYAIGWLITYMVAPTGWLEKNFLSRSFVAVFWPIFLFILLPGYWIITMLEWLGKNLAECRKAFVKWGWVKE